MASRRKFIKLIGGGTVFAVAAGGGCAAINGISQSARAPWRDAGQYEEYRKRFLSYALLAPNPHNRQPWLVKLEGEDRLTLYVDTTRDLPVTDPFDRQITIGYGTFLELMVLAAAQEGYRTELELFPEGEASETLDQRPVARARFIAGQAEPDPLFEYILDRRSNKKPYLDKQVEDKKLKALAETGRSFGTTAHTIGNTAMAERLRELTWQAHVKEMTTADAAQESIDLMRIGKRQVAANPDGIEIEGAFIAAAQLLGLMSAEQAGTPGTYAFKEGMRMYREMAFSARAFGWLSTPENDRPSQINAGRAYVRLNLKATELGLGIHPWSQALQEYSEMSELYTQVHEMIGGKERLQMLFRIGYSSPVAPTPRWGLEKHIV